MLKQRINLEVVNYMRLKLLNGIAPTTAFLIITSFIIFSLVSEFIGNHALIATIRRSIFYLLSLLIICMVISYVLYKGGYYGKVIFKREICI